MADPYAMAFDGGSYNRMLKFNTVVKAIENSAEGDVIPRSLCNSSVPKKRMSLTVCQ